MRPPAGFVHLILGDPEEQDDPLYLEIPIQIIHNVCLKPRKYLRYIGWCVLGIEGDLGDEEGRPTADLNGTLDDQGVYRYIVSGGNTLTYAVDLEVIRTRTHVPSETTDSREDFDAKILARDGYCVWTSLSGGAGIHIIPVRRGSEWLQLLIANRPHDSHKNLDDMLINDIRNGIFADHSIHAAYFDPRDAVVLKTPNVMLEIDDVPPRHQRLLAGGVSYPIDSRYTFQWLIEPPPPDLARHPDNVDATFANHDLAKPAELLLHYNYGAAAVKHWGKNIQTLQERSDIPRPSVSVPMVPIRTMHDRQNTTKPHCARSSKNSMERNTTQSGAREEDASSEKVERYNDWDEDDVMLFLWGNSKPARERHAQKKKELAEYMEHWRTTIDSEESVMYVDKP